MRPSDREEIQSEFEDACASLWKTILNKAIDLSDVADIQAAIDMADKAVLDYRHRFTPKKDED